MKLFKRIKPDYSYRYKPDWKKKLEIQNETWDKVMARANNNLDEILEGLKRHNDKLKEIIKIAKIAEEKYDKKTHTIACPMCDNMIDADRRYCSNCGDYV